MTPVVPTDILLKVSADISPGVLSGTAAGNPTRIHAGASSGFPTRNSVEVLQEFI